MRPCFVPCDQIGREKHRMFSVFMQVPRAVIQRLASRSQQKYDYRRLQRTQLGSEDNDDANQDEEVCNV